MAGFALYENWGYIYSEGFVVEIGLWIDYEKISAFCLLIHEWQYRYDGMKGWDG